MDPKKIDSKMGEFLSTLMFRKLENPAMTVPHIVRTKPLPRMRAKVYRYRLKARKINVPKYGRYESPQTPFGHHVE